jgi:hypothetical protein
MTATSEDTCTDCGKVRPITLRFKSAASIEANGVRRQFLVDVKLCRGCMRKRAQAKKKTT